MSCSSCTVCAVAPGGNGWMAECGTMQQGPYLSKDIAFRIAANEAGALRRNGQAARISIYDRDGGVSAEFCLCRNFKVS